MPKSLIALTPETVDERVRQGHALLIDIRENDEFARRHIPGALSRPLSRFDAIALPEMAGTDVIFTCRSGMRTATNSERLAAPVDGNAYLLEGGLDNWVRAGLPVIRGCRPTDIIRPASSPSLRSRSRQALACSKKSCGLPYPVPRI